jgi:molybdopterin converting factor small subunit
VGLEAPEENVIPYADLTPEIVIGWVQEKLGGEEKVIAIEEALQAQLERWIMFLVHLRKPVKDKDNIAFLREPTNFLAVKAANHHAYFSWY